MTLFRDNQKALVVEGMTEARLESADVQTFGQLTPTETASPVRVGGRQVLMGSLQFTLAKCTPSTVPSVIPGSCTGQGVIKPASRANGEPGLPLLRLGDTGTCQGQCLIQQGSSVVARPNVVCRLRIADSGQKPFQLGQGAKRAAHAARSSKKTQPLTLTIAFRAFIHKDLTLYGTEDGKDLCWAFEPWPFGQQIVTDDFGGGIETEIQFRGDCRDFGEKGTSRVAHEFQFDADTIGDLGMSSVKIHGAIGQSHQRIRRREIGVHMSDWTPWREYQDTARDQGHYIVRGGNQIEIVGSAAYPFSRFAPNIDYHVIFTFLRLDGKRVKVSFQGAHNLFPDYELIINGKLIWKYTTLDRGPSLVNLNRSRDFSGEAQIRFDSAGEAEIEVK